MVMTGRIVSTRTCTQPRYAVSALAPGGSGVDNQGLSMLSLYCSSVAESGRTILCEEERIRRSGGGALIAVNEIKSELAGKAE